MSNLETTEVLLVPCNIVNNDYQHDSRAFQINYLVGYQIIDQKIIIFLNAFNLHFPYVKVSFIDQNCKSIQREDRLNLALVTMCNKPYEIFNLI